MFPERIAKQRTGRITPYREAIGTLWREGSRTARSIYANLAKQGFTGSYYMVLRYLRRSKPELEYQSKSQHVVRRRTILSPRAVTWLLTRRSEDLSKTEQEQINTIEKGCSEVQSAMAIVRDFSDMIRNRDGLKWEGWLERATKSTTQPAIRGFASALKKDAAAVKAAIALPWSNGQLEGQINKLKMLKRQMYGRANLKLLEQRLIGVA